MKSFFGALALLIAYCGLAGATVNINIATTEDLTSLKGIGAKTAADIVEYRKTHGPFTTVDDLEKVPGVTPAFMKRIRPQISTSGSSVVRRRARTAPKHKSKASAANTAEPVKVKGLRSAPVAKIGHKPAGATKAQKKQSQ